MDAYTGTHYLCVYTYTYLCVYTYKMTPVLPGWHHSSKKETYPLIPCIMGHYRGFVSVGFCKKQITGGRKKTTKTTKTHLQTIQASGDLGWLKDEQLKELGILQLHFWACVKAPSRAGSLFAELGLSVCSRASEVLLLTPVSFGSNL